MAAKPYMPLYIADYMADTAHFGATEHGAYLLMIMTYWQTEKPLMDDDKKMAMICKISLRGYRQLKLNVTHLFDLVDGKFVHKRIEKELAEYRKKLIKNRESGAKGGRKTHENNYAKKRSERYSERYSERCSERSSSQSQSQSQSQSHTGSYTELARSTPNLLTQEKNQIPTYSSFKNDPPEITKKSDDDDLKNIDFGERQKYLDFFTSTFPNFRLTTKIAIGVVEWEKAGVTMEDIEQAIEQCRDRDISRPEYYLPVALQKCQERKSGRFKKNKKNIPWSEQMKEMERDADEIIKDMREGKSIWNWSN